MSGNVEEWAEDCWHDTYEGAPTDGTAWLATDGADCSQRVLRGGSWFFEPVLLRSSYRFVRYPSDRNYGLGFRLAQGTR